MHLIVGLGNPGEEYRQTPHNLGFLTIDELAERERIRVTRPEGGALVGLGRIAGEEVALVKPLSFMNRSGGPVKALAAKYEVPAKRILVIYDELALPQGTLRLRLRGSAAGHNGVKSLIASLKTEEFARLRMGVEPKHGRGDAAKYVLRPFREDALDDWKDMVGRAADIVRLYLSEGPEKAMTVANRRAQGQEKEEA